jgi:ABC-2 type transport system ATP-binding protein
MCSEVLIELRDVCYAYPSGGEVLRGLNLEVQRGEIYGLLGPNGAGKSTAFRVLVGLAEPTSGEALIQGRRTCAGDRNVYHEVAYMPDAGEVFDDSTVEDLLRFFGRCQQLEEAEIDARIAELLKRFHLVERRNQLIRRLSKGLRQQAHIMRCLIHNPKVLILDEPASHLDPISRAMLLDILRQEQARGATILISSHILPELSNLCTSLAIINGGRVVDHGRVSELLEKHQARVARYTIRVITGIDHAIEVLRRHSNSDQNLQGCERIGKELLTIDYAGTREQISTLIELLVRAGVRITEFERQRKDIEDIYAEIVRN